MVFFFSSSSYLSHFLSFYCIWSWSCWVLFFCYRFYFNLLKIQLLFSLLLLLYLTLICLLFRSISFIVNWVKKSENDCYCGCCNINIYNKSISTLREAIKIINHHFLRQQKQQVWCKDGYKTVSSFHLFIFSFFLLLLSHLSFLFLYYGFRRWTTKKHRIVACVKAIKTPMR